MVRDPRRPPDRCACLAWAMVVAGVVSLFRVEIVVALLFVLSWLVQTVEQLPRR